MRIGIDVSVLCNQWDGIGTYTIDVLKYIFRTPSTDEYYLYADRKLETELKFDKRFHLFVDEGTNHLLWLLTKLPKYAKRDSLDVFWQPNFLLPFRIKGMCNVVNVHDMSAYAYSKFASTKTNITHKLFLRPTCEKSDTILAISNNGAKEIVKYFPKVKEKVQTIYIGKKMFENGLDANEGVCSEYLEELGLVAKDYLLFVGTLSPRKNANVIIDSYFEYRKKGGKKKLVLAGNIATKCINIKKVIEQNRYGKDVVIAGYITDQQKRILYYHAAMLLFPSRLEGFGFPILEGMQAKIPVITSNCSCMPEIAGDAAVYLNDIDSAEELALHILEVEQMSPEEQSLMIARGLERVAYFDGLHYPQLVLEAIHNAKDKQGKEL